MDDEQARKMGNLIAGLDAIHNHKLSRAALAFAELETTLEEMLPPENPNMQAISRLLESASMLFGAAVAVEKEPQ